MAALTPTGLVTLPGTVLQCGIRVHLAMAQGYIWAWVDIPPSTDFLPMDFQDGFMVGRTGTIPTCTDGMITFIVIGSQAAGITITQTGACIREVREDTITQGSVVVPAVSTIIRLTDNKRQPRVTGLHPEITPTTTEVIQVLTVGHRMVVLHSAVAAAGLVEVVDSTEAEEEAEDVSICVIVIKRAGRVTGPFCVSVVIQESVLRKQYGLK